MKRALSFILPSLNILMGFLISLMIAYSFCSTPFVHDQSLSKVISDSSTSLRYLSYGCDDPDSSLMSFYYKNFSSENIYTTSYFNDNLPVTSYLYLGTDSYGSSSFIDLVDYDNQITLKRFKTININLYKTPDAEQNEKYSCNGTVYIPDYLANQIIENNGLNGYDDLLPDFSSMDETERNSFLSSYSIKMEIGGSEHSYRISNIFHLDGFKEEYCSEPYEYNDGDASKNLSSFYGNYMIINDEELGSIYSQRMVVGCVSKQYALYDEIKEARKIGGNFPTIYDVHDDEFSINREYTDLLRKSFSYRGLEGYQIVLLIIGILLLGSLFFLNIFFRKKIEGKTYLFSSIGIVGIMLILQIIYVAWGQYNLGFMTIYNAPFNMVMVSCLILFIMMWPITRRRKNNG